MPMYYSGESLKKETRRLRLFLCLFLRLRRIPVAIPPVADLASLSFGTGQVCVGARVRELSDVPS